MASGNNDGQNKITAHIKRVQRDNKDHCQNIFLFNHDRFPYPGFQSTFDEKIVGFSTTMKPNTINENGSDVNTKPQIDRQLTLLRQNNNRRKLKGNTNGSSAKKPLVLDIFYEIKNAIMAEDLDELRTLVQDLYSNYDKTLLSTICKEYNITNTHLITLACKHKQTLILDFLLNESDLLYYLPNNTANVKKAFRNAIMSNNSKNLEMLYDYWSGEVHWLAVSNNNSVDLLSNLKLLTEVLRESKSSCTSKYPQMIADVRCLKIFNDFQIKLYSELYTLIKNEPKSEIEAIKDVILIAYKIYIEFTKEINSPDKLTLSHFDDIYIGEKCYNYLINDIYHRKMDFNIALLILNNLYLLKQRLNMPNNAYQEIECTLYYFLFGVIEDWKVYLEENRPVFEDTVTSIDEKKHLKNILQYNVPCDPQRRYNAPVLYLERKKFIRELTTFIETLKVTTVERIQTKNILPNEEINSLIFLPYMRDDYSLKKMMKYMKAISKVNFEQDKTRSLFIVQRVIQVIGEFMKNSETGDTIHLSATTKAILQAEIPKKTIKLIENIRDNLSHAKNGNLIRRIDLETNEYEIIKDSILDLKYINKAIGEVIKLYEPILEKSRISSGTQLFENWICSLLEYESLSETEAKDFLKYLHKYDNFLMSENEFLNTIKKYELSQKFELEIQVILFNKHYMRTRRVTMEKESIKNALRKLSKYTAIIQRTLKEMENPNNNIKNKELIDNWVQIRSMFEFFIVEVNFLRLHRFPFTRLLEVYWKTVLGDPDTVGIASAIELLQFTTKHYQDQKLHISNVPEIFINNKAANLKNRLHNMEDDNNKWTSVQKYFKVLSKKHILLKNYPNKECIQTIKDTLKESIPNSIKQTLDELKDWSDDWNEIKNEFKFIIIDEDLFGLHNFTQFKIPLEDYWNIALCHPNVSNISSANRLLNRINEEAKEFYENQMQLTPERETAHDFEQIEFLANKMNRNWFLTNEEIKYLLKNINFKCNCTAGTFNCCAHFNIIAQKIQNNEPLTGTEYKKLKTLNLTMKCRKTVENLVMGCLRDSKMLECLINRTHHLEDLLERCQDEKQLVLRYKNDESFRIVIEMIISDIMNIFADDRLKKLLEIKFSKILSGIPLRNVLNHGNPYLEVIGAALDPNDVPSAVITSALNYIKDGTYIKYLFKLYEDEVDRHDVYCSTNLKGNQLDLVNNFKKCSEWKTYIKLLPTKKQMHGAKKKVSTKAETTT